MNSSCQLVLLLVIVVYMILYCLPYFVIDLVMEII